jgi:uncharacterized protein
VATNGKLKILYELGEASTKGEWPDYLQYGYDGSDVPALLALVADQSLNNAERNSDDIWVPLHAWRTLGQLKSPKAISPLIALFEELVEDDWAISELSLVMGMIGEAAISPLATYLNEPDHSEFARVMAMDGLAEIALRHPETRGHVIESYQTYMNQPDDSTGILNGLLIGRLLDLKAKEAINDIRQMFERGCVDISCAGDLEDVEMELGFRTERSTSKPVMVQFPTLDTPDEPKKPSGDNFLDVIDYALKRYGQDSLYDASELDGFFAALACAPDTIMPSQWIPAIWGGIELMPEWEDENELESFTQAVFTLYNHVMESLNEDRFQALFNEYEDKNKIHIIPDNWCGGFMQGIDLWGPLPAEDADLAEELIQPIKLFMSEEGYNQRQNMSKEEVEAQRELIEPNVRTLFQHFFQQRNRAQIPVVREKEKIGRNDPCFCGSGKKFKKCCLH